MEKIKTSRILLALAAVSLAVAISHIASSLVAALYIIGIVGASLYLSYLFKSDNYDSIFAVPTYGIFDAKDLVVPASPRPRPTTRTTPTPKTLRKRSMMTKRS